VTWRTLLIDGPARITEIAFTWYRLYLVVMLCAVAFTPPIAVLAILVLWFGFGIRWGW